MEKKRGQFAYQIGTEFSTKHGNLTVVSMRKTEIRPGKFQKYYMLQCRKGHQYEVNESYLCQDRLRTCKLCSHPPISETDPDFAEWFTDIQVPREKSRYSHALADFYCQTCGKTVRDKRIHTVYQRKYVPCPYCKDGISYPERYINAFLTQLNIAFQHQYTVYFNRGGIKGHYKYDFFDKERRILLEAHGIQHFVPGVFSRIGGQSYEIIRERDLEKEKFAQETLNLKYISLDCRKSEADWIRNEILRKLDFYPLDKVDWEKVRQDAGTSVTLKMIELYQEGYTQKEIGDILHLHPATVCQKLKKAAEDKLFDGKSPRSEKAELKKNLQKEKSKKRAEKKQKLQEQKEYLQKLQSDFQILRKQDADILPAGSYTDLRSPLSFVCLQCGQEFIRSPGWLLKHRNCPYCEKTASIQKRITERYKEQFQVLSVYRDCRTPLEMYHTVCGEKFQMTYTDFWKRGCPVCGRHNRAANSAKTRKNLGLQEFYSKLPELQKRGYTLESVTWMGLGTPHEFRCHHCGEIWEVSPRAVMEGRDHICISSSRKKTPEEFAEQIRLLTGEEYTVLTEYQNAFKPVKIRHNVCGQEYSVRPVSFTSKGRRCLLCRQARRAGSGHKEPV